MNDEQIARMLKFRMPEEVDEIVRDFERKIENETLRNQSADFELH